MFYSYIKENITTAELQKLPIKQLSILIDMLEEYDRQYSEFGKDNLRKIAEKCTIGKFIEILSQDSNLRPMIIPLDNSEWEIRINSIKTEGEVKIYKSKELCDALWCGVKSVLKELVELKEQ